VSLPGNGSVSVSGVNVRYHGWADVVVYNGMGYMVHMGVYNNIKYVYNEIECVLVIIITIIITTIQWHSNVFVPFAF
jgi:hypothetical protein